MSRHSTFCTQLSHCLQLYLQVLKQNHYVVSSGCLSNYYFKKLDGYWKLDTVVIADSQSDEIMILFTLL